MASSFPLGSAKPNGMQHSSWHLLRWWRPRSWQHSPVPVRADHPCLFASAQLQLLILDRFGNYLEPQEWFVLPLRVIDEVIHRNQDGTITDFVYDVSTGKLRKA
jgi:hypothetical protein